MASWKGTFHVRYWKRKFSGDWRKTQLSMRSCGFETREAALYFVGKHPADVYRVKLFENGELIYEH